MNWETTRQLHETKFLLHHRHICKVFLEKQRDVQLRL
jgi:hypothetical protein